MSDSNQTRIVKGLPNKKITVTRNFECELLDQWWAPKPWTAETKTEIKKLFDALSQGGNLVMPLADMFFGAYFGTCTDRFGINWMFNTI